MERFQVAGHAGRDRVTTLRAVSIGRLSLLEPAGGTSTDGRSHCVDRAAETQESESHAGS